MSVSRPMDDVVLNCWVTETNETPWASKVSMILAKSARERTQRRVTPEDVANRLGFLLHDYQLAILAVVAERRVAAHPHTLFLGRRDLVADALASDLGLELGE